MIKAKRLRKRVKILEKKKSWHMKTNPNIHWINIEIEGGQYSLKGKWFKNRTKNRRKWTLSVFESVKIWERELYLKVEKSFNV